MDALLKTFFDAVCVEVRSNELCGIRGNLHRRRHHYCGACNQLRPSQKLCILFRHNALSNRRLDQFQYVFKVTSVASCR